ncbi:MAG: hypothetical protein QXI58_00405 [Candidatus Micrarchaeia archaeon]|jgi:hypothetical protein
MIDFNRIIKQYGNFTVYGSTNINYSIKKSLQITEGDFITITNISELEIFMIVEGYNPIPPERGFVHMVIWRAQGPSKFEFKLISVLDYGDFKVKALLSPPVVYTYPYVLVEFYVSSEIGGKPEHWLPIKIMDNSLAMSLLNYNRYSSFYKHIIIPSFYRYNIPPRLLGVYQRLRRDIQVWGSAMVGAGRKLFVMAVKTGGSTCPFHGHSSDELMSSRKDDAYHHIDVKAYQADEWCSKCLGTMMLGAFDYITLAYGGLFTSSVVNEYGEYLNVGKVIIEASTPIKPGDFVTDLNDVYIINPPNEVREFYELPIYYTAPVRSLPSINPIRRVVPFIVRNFTNYVYRYRIPLPSKSLEIDINAM